MKLTTNIVLTGNKGATSPYMVKLTRNINDAQFKYIREDDEPYPGQHISLNINSQGSAWHRKANEWYFEDWNPNEIVDVYDLDSATIRLYFPQYSVDTYSPRCTYSLTFTTYIHGIEIELGSFIFKRNDTLACPPTKFNGMDDYFEYMDFTIADPFSLLYKTNPIKTLIDPHPDLNDNGSMLYISLNIVEEQDGHYIMKDGWTGGQNGLLISDPEDLKLVLSYDNNTKSIKMQLEFNHEYEGDLERYLRETYNCSSSAIEWQYVIMDDTDIYYEESKVFVVAGDFDNSFSFSFLVRHTPEETGESESREYMKVDNNPVFSSWDNWKPGLVIQGTASIESTESVSEEGINPFMTIFSNKIPLTLDMFSMIVCPKGYENFPTTINLDDLDMNNINLTAVNKIEQEVTVIAPEDNAKKNIIQPVFYQTRDVNNVIIHPSVTENISITINTSGYSYRRNSKSFMVMIEGVTFPEIGRSGGNVIFKISGNMLPKVVNEGILYILDGDGEVVTTGKYTYVS